MSRRIKPKPNTGSKINVIEIEYVSPMPVPVTIRIRIEQPSVKEPSPPANPVQVPETLFKRVSHKVKGKVTDKLIDKTTDWVLSELFVLSLPVILEGWLRFPEITEMISKLLS